MKRISSILGLGALAISLGAVVACDSDGGGDDRLVQLPNDGKPGGGFNLPEKEKTVLDERVIDYSDALRVASIKLLDLPPTLQQIHALDQASDRRAAYEVLVDEMLKSPRFSRRMIRFWRDTFRQGGGEFDSAPVFAARLVVEGKPFTELFTASENTCPSYDGASEAFVDGNCNNGVDEHAGVLTNPGTMRQFYGNMAFRRVRWVQEVFACQKYPAEYGEEPQDIDGATYTAPWAFNSIASDPINFRDTSSVVCANCHATMNHLAPLFGNFDENGQFQGQISVMTPIAPDPVNTEISHWLSDGETTAWRKGVPVANLVELGQAMANDPVVAQCVVARMWNFTMSKEDIVNDLATVPASVISEHVNRFVNNDYNVKSTLRGMLLSDDFVSF